MGKLILTLGLVCLFVLAVGLVGCEKQAPPAKSITTTTNTTSTTSTTVVPALPTPPPPPAK
jgi:hypothetical protein